METFNWLALGYSAGRAWLVVSPSSRNSILVDADSRGRHLLTALSAHYMIVWLAWLRYYQEGREDEVYLEWPSLWTSLPAIHKKIPKRHVA